jgi:hypothetical protein
MTIEERIFRRFIEKLGQDESIPPEMIQQIEALWKDGGLKNPDAVLDAIRRGVNAHGQNTTS